MNALGHCLLSLPCACLCWQLPDLASSPVWAGAPKRLCVTPSCTWHDLGWDHCDVLLALLQLPGRPPQRTAGCLALPLLEPVLGICACSGCCLVRQGLCPAASKGWLSPVIPSDIVPCFQLWPVLLCLSLWLGTADAGTKRSGQLLLAPALDPQGAARTSCTVTHAAAGAGKGSWDLAGKGPRSNLPSSLGPGSFEMLVAPQKLDSDFPLPERNHSFPPIDQKTPAN